MTPPSKTIQPSTGPAPASWRDDGAAIDLDALQVEAERLGRLGVVEALRRLALLEELRDCLADEVPGAAQEVALFRSEALVMLASDLDADTAEQAADSVLQESNARWGAYLGLLDPSQTDLADPDGLLPSDRPSAAVDEVPAAIDPGVLFRMLTGDDARPFDSSDGWTPPPPERNGSHGRVEHHLERGGEARALFPPLLDTTTDSDSDLSSSAATRPAFEVPPPPSSLTIDPELRAIFLDEASDLFDRIETLVLSFGRGERQADLLLELGRCFHTLKGAAGSVGLVQVAALVHAIEDRLELVNGQAASGLIDSLHEILHYLEGVFIAIRRSGPNASTPVEDPRPPTPVTRSAPPSLAARTAVSSSSARFQKNSSAAAPPLSSSSKASPSSSLSPTLASSTPASDRGAGTRPGHQTSSITSVVKEPAAIAPTEAALGEGPVRVSSERVDELMDLVSELITRRGLWVEQAQRLKEFAALARCCRARMMATIDKLRDTRQMQESRGPIPKGRGVFDRRTDVPEMIRRLAEQSEDLVVLTETAQAAAEPMADNSDALARLTLKLWESLQAIRIVPVRGLFQRLARVAHDAARVEGRNVEVAMVGEETGLDRAVQDKAFEPLLHVVRNAVCHGIEPPDERTRRGKPAAGRVTLEAARAGNTLVISVQDDGKGLDYDAIAAKGRRLGLIGLDEAAGVDRLGGLIFQPGFSTRDEATAIAGRGVGMDVVSQEVGRLHGTIALTSARGQGVRLSVSLPARLALEQAMLLRIDGQPFALPVDLIELAQPLEPADVEWAGTPPKVRIRDQSVPLVAAREALGFPAAAALSCPKLLLIRADGELLALLVDTIEGTRELVIKPLEPLLSGNPVVSGKSLSVTGEVIFALNPSGLARWLREVGGSGGLAADLPEAPSAATILVVDDSISVRKVVARNFRALGFEVDEVSDGLEALGRLRTHSFAMVFSDLDMPRMDGFELLAELNRLAISTVIPVVVASTRSDPETRRRVLDLGAREFLPKPIDPANLAAVVRDLLPGSAVAGPSPAHAGSSSSAASSASVPFRGVPS